MRINEYLQQLFYHTNFFLFTFFGVYVISSSFFFLFFFVSVAFVLWICFVVVHFIMVFAWWETFRFTHTLKSQHISMYKWKTKTHTWTTQCSFSLNRSEVGANIWNEMESVYFVVRLVEFWHSAHTHTQTQKMLWICLVFGRITKTIYRNLAVNIKIHWCLCEAACRCV